MLKQRCLRQESLRFAECRLALVRPDDHRLLVFLSSRDHRLKGHKGVIDFVPGLKGYQGVIYFVPRLKGHQGIIILVPRPTGHYRIINFVLRLIVRQGIINFVPRLKAIKG